MQTETQPLRDEHRDFSDPLEAIRHVADGVGELSLPELRRQIDEVHAFLVDRFIPHLRVDEEAVDPLIERVLDVHSPTEPTVEESVEVGRLAGNLLELCERLVYSYFGPGQLRSLQTVLYDLHALIEAHLAEGDELYGALLHKGITAAEAREMLQEVGAAEKVPPTLESVSRLAT
jgi:Hemerythrin HHE cation binding domain